jgi:hypothetical protein
MTLALVLAAPVYAEKGTADLRTSKITRDLIAAPQYAYTPIEDKRESRGARLPVVQGWMLGRNKTPFAPLFADYYEQVKPAGH